MNSPAAKDVTEAPTDRSARLTGTSALGRPRPSPRTSTLADQNDPVQGSSSPVGIADDARQRDGTALHALEQTAARSMALRRVVWVMLPDDGLTAAVQALGGQCLAGVRAGNRPGRKRIS